MSPITIYCLECEAPNDETRPTCSNCGHQLKPDVTHTFSLKELAEQRMHLAFKLQAAREIETILERRGNATSKDADAINEYRARVTDQMRVVDDLRSQAVEEARYPLNDSKPFDNDRFMSQVRNRMQNWRHLPRITTNADFRDGYVDGIVEIASIVLDMNTDSVRGILSRHLPPSPDQQE